MKRFSLLVSMVALVSAGFAFTLRGVPLSAELTAPEQGAGSTTVTVPEIAFDSDTSFLKYSPDMNLGEVLAVAVSSKGRIVVLNHPGSSTNGPLYGNASTQLLEFDATGKYVREIGKNVYGLLAVIRNLQTTVLNATPHFRKRGSNDGGLTSKRVHGRHNLFSRVAAHH